MLREGIEDYEYLWLLKDKGAGEFAEEKIRNVVVYVSTYLHPIAFLL